MLLATAAMKGYADHRWGGFQQIKAAGGHVRRGERSHWICIMRTVRGSESANPEAQSLELSTDSDTGYSSDEGN